MTLKAKITQIFLTLVAIIKTVRYQDMVFIVKQADKAGQSHKVYAGIVRLR